MFFENLVARIDKAFHDHGDILIKAFSVIVALLLLGLWFLSTNQSLFKNAADEIQQATQ
jgi:hypothetical protein